MSIKTKNELKTSFQSGTKLTEEKLSNLIDSIIHQNEDNSVVKNIVGLESDQTAASNEDINEINTSISNIQYDLSNEPDSKTANAYEAIKALRAQNAVLADTISPSANICFFATEISGNFTGTVQTSTGYVRPILSTGALGTIVGSANVNANINLNFATGIATSGVRVFGLMAVTSSGSIPATGASITLINFISKSIIAFDVVGCSGLTNLIITSSSGSKLSYLPNNSFSGLNSLSVLYLHSNAFSTLPIGVFDGLSSLSDLRLNNNQFTTLPSGIFDGLSSLSDLRLNNNQFTTLPSGIFDGLINLGILYLNDNLFTTLPIGLFDGLSSLNTLDLNNNQISTLPIGIFDGLINLNTLYLDSNQITTLPIEIFDGLSNLYNLGLSSNQITTLQVELFDGLNNLRILYLSDNQITTLPIGIFDGLINLDQIYLNNNQITTLPNGIFSGKILFHIGLSNNLLNLDAFLNDFVTYVGTMPLGGYLDIDSGRTTASDAAFEIITSEPYYWTIIE
jgi:Leucine-rich repeat (LRR) protein